MKALMIRHEWWFDEYVGSAEQLAEHGIIRPEYLPGAPGLGKHQVTIYAGVPWNGPGRAPNDHKRMTISRTSTNRYSVRKLLPKEEVARRKAVRHTFDGKLELYEPLALNFSPDLGVRLSAFKSLPKRSDGYMKFMALSILRTMPA